MRLLVIEDDATLRGSLAARLGETGFAVEQAADGKEGLYFASEYPIDLAIIDLGLPEVSGIDIIKQVRADGHTYPILILTARDRWEDKVDGLVADQAICVLTVLRNPDMGLVTLNRPLNLEPIGIAVPASDPLLLNLVENYMTALESSGALEKLEEKWFKSGGWLVQLP